MTPPKRIPPWTRPRASGTLPTEHTKLTKAMSGPTTAFSTLVHPPWPLNRTARNTLWGTAASRNPATTKPMTSSRRSMPTSDIV
jgi:hypothetical protein